MKKSKRQQQYICTNCKAPAMFTITDYERWGNVYERWACKTCKCTEVIKMNY